MPITTGNVSSDDSKKLNDYNENNYVDGFEEPNQVETGFDSLFDDDLWGDSSSGSSGSSGGSDLDIFGNVSQGDNGSIGGINIGGGGSIFDGMNQQQQQAQPQQKDRLDVWLDTLMDLGEKYVVNLKDVLVELVKSVKLRCADDVAFMSRNVLTSGIAFIVLSVVSIIIGAVATIPFLGFSGFGLQMLLAGITLLSAGITGYSVSAYILVIQSERIQGESPEDMEDLDSLSGNSINDYENNIASETEDSMMDELSDLLGYSSDSDSDIESNSEPDEEDDWLKHLMGDEDEDKSSSDTGSNEFTMGETFAPQSEEVDFGKAVESVREDVGVLSRKFLLETFSSMLPSGTPNFAQEEEIEPGTEEFNAFQDTVLKALSNLIKCNIDETGSKLEKLVRRCFSYEMRVKRVKGLKNLTEIERELEVYFRQDDKDLSVNAMVSIIGDFYRIVLTTGDASIVTLGDILKNKEHYDFFANEKNILPFVMGIDDTGAVYLEDAQKYNAMMFTGLPRSGKSWTVLSIIMNLALFNTPEDVQFCIIDPKETNQFHVVSLLPHVMGLHYESGSKVIDIIRDIIDNEAPRRKRLIADNKVENIFQLRKKGIRVPILYILIDEYLTVVTNLGNERKELDNLVKVIVTQLPSLGIRPIIIPHRATGAVDKTVRSNINYVAAIRAKVTDAAEALGVSSWKTPLTLPGEMGIITDNLMEPIKLRSSVLTPSDDTNSELIMAAAKIFYKLGVDIPDYSHLRVACTRDEDEIRMELEDDSSGNRVQYDANKVKEALDNIDMYNPYSDSYNEIVHGDANYTDEHILEFNDF